MLSSSKGRYALAILIAGAIAVLALAPPASSKAVSRSLRERPAYDGRKCETADCGRYLISGWTLDTSKATEDWGKGARTETTLLTPAGPVAPVGDITPCTANGGHPNGIDLVLSNRAAYGAEIGVFQAYPVNLPVETYGWKQTDLSVYDWGPAGNGAYNIIFVYGTSQAAPYVYTKTIGGTNFNAVDLRNASIWVSSTQWRNLVHLRNQNTGAWDLVYDSGNYNATYLDQQTGGGCCYQTNMGDIEATISQPYPEDSSFTTVPKMGFDGIKMSYIPSSAPPGTDFGGHSYFMTSSKATWFSPILGFSTVSGPDRSGGFISHASH